MRLSLLKNGRLKFSSAIPAAAVLLSAMFLNGVAFAGDAPQWLQTENLSGEWGGTRQSLKDKGVDVSLALTLESQTNVSGGVRRTSLLLGKTELGVGLDSEKLGLWRQGAFYFSGLGTFGADPSRIVGDQQWTSNIEARDTFRLFSAWYDHRFYDGKLSLLAGLHDYNSEFYVTKHSAAFLNRSFGVGLEAFQAGLSMFPDTGWAARLKADLPRGGYLLAAVYDGVPRLPGHADGTPVILDDADGLFYASEFGLTGAKDGSSSFKAALGVWHHTLDFQDASGILRRGVSGVYGLLESSLYREADRSQGLGGFFRLGFSDRGKSNAISDTALGFDYTGLVPGRDKDVAGVALSRVLMSQAYQDANPGSSRTETALEFVYNARVLPWLRVVPDVQVVMNPGADRNLNDAVLMNLRAVIQF